MAKTADSQIDGLIAFFAAETSDRQPNPEAIDILLASVEGARALLLSGRGLRRKYPAAYREMACESERWLKVHRYWSATSSRQTRR